MEPLRENFRTVKKMVRACHHKVDGLRILQYIKWRYTQFMGRDEENLSDFLQYFYPDDPLILDIDWKNLSFENSDLASLEMIRNSLAAKEATWQQ